MWFVSTQPWTETGQDQVQDDGSEFFQSENLAPEDREGLNQFMARSGTARARSGTARPPRSRPSRARTRTRTRPGHGPGQAMVR